MEVGGAVVVGKSDVVVDDVVTSRGSAQEVRTIDARMIGITNLTKINHTKCIKTHYSSYYFYHTSKFIKYQGVYSQPGAA